MSIVLKNWICTDPDCSQFCKKLSDSKYQFVEVRHHKFYNVVIFTVDLKDYTLDDIWGYCKSYYDSFETIVSDYGFMESFRIMAECIFEGHITLFDMDKVISFDEEYQAYDAVLQYVQEND